VAHARIQREATEVFRQLHAGTVTMQEALKTFNGEIDDARRQEAKAARSEFSREANDPAKSITVKAFRMCSTETL